MSGWILLVGLAAVSLLLLVWPGRLDRGALMMVASALLVAVAGYTWQGSPDQPGAPKSRDDHHALRPETVFATEHNRFLVRFGEQSQWLGEADAMNRLGEDQVAVAFMRGAVKKFPKSPDMWIGYAHALFVLADGNLSPAVQLTFDRAQALDPANPAPRYFLGLTALEAGNLPGAEAQWRALEASLPAGSPWRGPLQERLAVFDLMRKRAAMAAGSPQSQQPGPAER